MKEIVSTPNAPAAVGPYSQAIACENFLFCSGQIPLDPATGEMVTGDVAAQTEQVCKNIGALLKARRLRFRNVVKSTVYLTDMADFAAMNEVYARYFQEPFPTRSTVAVSALPKGAKVEIEVVGYAVDAIPADLGML